MWKISWAEWSDIHTSMLLTDTVEIFLYYCSGLFLATSYWHCDSLFMVRTSLLQTLFRSRIHFSPNVCDCDFKCYQVLLVWKESPYMLRDFVSPICITPCELHISWPCQQLMSSLEGQVQYGEKCLNVKQNWMLEFSWYLFLFLLDVLQCQESSLHRDSQL